MPVRILHAIFAGLLLALVGYCVGFYLGGARAGVLASCVAAVSGAALGATARSASTALLRLTLSSCLLIAVHVAALYTFRDDGHAPWISANVQLLLAVPALVACGVLWGRLRALPMTAPERNDDDPTLEIRPQLSQDPVLGTDSPQGARWRTGVALGVLCAALLVMATLFWLGGNDGSNAPLGNAVARELPAVDMPDVPERDEVPAAPDVAATPQAASDPPATPADNAVAPSAARRECMAQIESARLFRQLAQQSDDRSLYSSATDTHISRMLKARPVGPRTLSRIADRMWESRSAPEREPSWWASQFRRCEDARTAGAWYVVRG